MHIENEIKRIAREEAQKEVQCLYEQNKTICETLEETQKELKRTAKELKRTTNELFRAIKALESRIIKLEVNEE